MRTIVLALGIVLVGQACGAEAAHRRPTSVQEKPMRLLVRDAGGGQRRGWLDQSLPLGNGYFRVNVFGGVARERLQLTENSLVDTPSGGIGGLNNFAEVALEFPHATPRRLSARTRPRQRHGPRSLQPGRRDVQPQVFRQLSRQGHGDPSGGLAFGRSRLHAAPARALPGAFRRAEGDRRGKHATVTAKGDLITLSGVMDYYGIKFEAQFKVIPHGGVLRAGQGADEGSISVRGADSAVILIALGTNYRLAPRVFLEKDPAAKLATAFPVLIRR
ncbi:glycoside hydrolase N-terminal domain-containing protein [Caulobacter segnis]